MASKTKSTRKYVLKFGCWRSPIEKSKHQSPPLEFSSKEKAIAQFQLKKEKLAQMNYQVWQCVLINPDGEIEELC